MLNKDIFKRPSNKEDFYEYNDMLYQAYELANQADRGLILQEFLNFNKGYVVSLLEHGSLSMYKSYPGCTHEDACSIVHLHVIELFMNHKEPEWAPICWNKVVDQTREDIDRQYRQVKMSRTTRNRKLSEGKEHEVNNVFSDEDIQKDVKDLNENSDPYLVFEKKEQNEVLNRSISNALEQSLIKKDWFEIVLRRVNGAEYEDIASEFGITEQSARQRYSRTIRGLHNVLVNDGIAEFLSA